MRRTLAGAMATAGLAAGMLVIAPSTTAAPGPDSDRQQPECLYQNDSGSRQPIKDRPRRGSDTVGHVGRGGALWGPCRSTTDGGRYKDCGPGRSRVWTRVFSDRGWIKTRCFDRLQ